MILFGVLILVSAILLQQRSSLDVPIRGEFATQEEYVEARQAYKNTMTMMTLTSWVMLDVVVFLLVVFSLLVGGRRTDLSDSFRRNLVIFALVVFILWWITLVAPLLTVFRPVIPTFPPP